MNLTDLVKNDAPGQLNSTAKGCIPIASQISVSEPAIESKRPPTISAQAEKLPINMNQQVTQIFQTTQNASSAESPTEIDQEAKEAEPRKKCTCSKGQCKKMYCVCLRSAQSCDKNVCQCKDCQNDDTEPAVRAREA